MNKIGIFGCSGFSKETADIACELNLQPILIAESESDASTLGHQYEYILEHELERFSDLPLAIGIGDNQIREKLFNHYHHRTFKNLIHPSATFGYKQLEHLDSKKGLIICAGVRMTNSIQMGDGCIVNLNTTIGHDCIIDSYVNIAPSANISGNVHIESGCWIGTNAAINQGHQNTKLIIGHGTIIGSGSVVTKSCEPDSIYAGVPARKIK